MSARQFLTRSPTRTLRRIDLNHTIYVTRRVVNSVVSKMAILFMKWFKATAVRFRTVNVGFRKVALQFIVVAM